MIVYYYKVQIYQKFILIRRIDLLIVLFAGKEINVINMTFSLSVRSSLVHRLAKISPTDKVYILTKHHRHNAPIGLVPETANYSHKLHFTQSGYWQSFLLRSGNTHIDKFSIFYNAYDVI